MRIIVSGANGQLGSEIRELRNSYPNFEFHFFGSKELDITNQQMVESAFESIKPAYFINCAAYTAVDNAEDEPEKANEVNAIGPKNISKSCLAHNCLLIHISTDYVFNGKNNSPYEPNQNCEPIGIYGTSKFLGESYIKELGANALVIRTAWVFSSYGKNFVKTMINLGKSRDKLNVVNDQIGAPTYAKDLATSILEMIKNGYKPKGFELHHFTNTGVCSWAQFASEIMQTAKLACEIEGIPTSEYPTKAERPAYSVLSLNSFTGSFPYLPIRTWQAALKDCISRLV